VDTVQPLPTRGAVFFDLRDEGRSMRVSFHANTGVYVVSLWRDEQCLGTFRLPASEAPRLVHALVSSLAEMSRDAADDRAETA
jgi:hypothetical protein